MMRRVCGAVEVRVERICFVLKVRKECIGEYKRRHREVWPEMRKVLQECGWRDYTLFLREDGLLVGYLVTEDFAEAQAAMQRTEVNRRWQEEMAPYFEGLDSAVDDEMKPMEEVFHVD